MLATLETEHAKNLYARRKQTVEPVFGSIKAAIGVTRFHLRGPAKVSTEWTRITLAYHGRSLNRVRTPASAQPLVTVPADPNPTAG